MTEQMKFIPVLTEDSSLLGEAYKEGQMLVDITNESILVDIAGERLQVAQNSPAFELPIASKSILGGIKVGNNLAVTTEGVLSATKQTDNNFTTAFKTKLTNLPDNANFCQLSQSSTNGYIGVNYGSGTSNILVYTLPSEVIKTGDNVSRLNNDGDGASPYATQQYVALNGGKIDVIKVNGIAQQITPSDKSVDITVPNISVEVTGAVAQ